MIQKTGRFPCTLPGRGDRADLSCESNPAHRLPLCAKSHRTGSPSLPVLYPVSGFKHISAQTCLHVILHQLFQNFVTFYLHNQASGALMAGNVGRISRHDISHNLVDGIVPLLRQRAVHLLKNLAHFQLCIILYCFKKLCISHITHGYHSRPLTTLIYSNPKYSIRQEKSFLFF